MATVNCKIGVREFGPIKEGFGRDLMDIKSCTLFVGPQGSGKSTVAKLIAEFAWLEKSLLRGNVTIEELQQEGCFRERYCAYHRLSSFFREDTEIHYVGQFHDFDYSEDRLRVKPRRGEMSKISKVMYIPAERNVFSIMEKTGMAQYFTSSLRTFWDAYEDARFALREDLLLPVDGISFEYDRSDKTGWVKGSGFRTRLSESASGYQSLVPLFLVSWYLAEMVGKSVSSSETDPESFRRLQQEVADIMKNQELADDVRTAALRNLSSRFRYSHFVNIVEEPELNLYPVSQRDLLQVLVGWINRQERNQLVLTTHSPYILSALNNLLFAWEVGQKFPQEAAQIIPVDDWLAPDRISAYALENGRIVDIMDSEIHQIEAERIDGVSEELNAQYEQLLQLGM